MDLIQIFEKHPHWQDIVSVVRKLMRANHQVMLAGGCVRDALLKRNPYDFDLATSATPDEVLKIFPKAVTVGKQFGVIILTFNATDESGIEPYDKFKIEVATFRREGAYKDGRRPEIVEYTKSAKEDAERRDFTVNALFYDFKTCSIVDYVSGEKDLNSRLLRTVGDPYKRFDEDKLRILRMARFAAQLGFDIESETLKAATALAPQIVQVSKERITEEFKKIATAQDPVRGFVALRSTGLLNTIWPEFLCVNNDELWFKLLRVLQLIAPVASFELMLATLMLFETLTKAEIKNETEIENKDKSKLPFLLSREHKKIVEFLIRGFFVLKSNDDESLFYLNEEQGPLLTELCHVFSLVGMFPSGQVEFLIEKFLQAADSQGFLPKPFLNGEDMKSLGVQPSQKMGELLKHAYLAQIKGQLKTQKEAQVWVLERLTS